MCQSVLQKECPHRHTPPVLLPSIVPITTTMTVINSSPKTGFTVSGRGAESLELAANPLAFECKVSLSAAYFEATSEW